jgi:hypothetical protein
VRKSLAFGLLLMMVCLASMTASFASAVDYTKVGVKVGDTADYSAGIGNTTSRLRMHVTQIVGTNVTLLFRNLDTDGSETDGYNLTGNIGGLNLIYVFLVVPNLNQGDPIFSGAPPGFAIDQQTTMTVAGSNRIVNHYGISISDVSVDIYWDKITGLAVKVDEQISSIHLTFDMLSTTAFGVNIDPVTLVIIGGGIAALIVVVLVVGVVMNRRKVAASTVPE